MSPSLLSSSANRLLASLSPGDAEPLAPNLKPIEFKVRHVFFKPRQPIEVVVFPESGFASVVAITDMGHSLEVGIIGREGVVGVPVIFGQTLTPYDSYAQAAGAGFEIKSDILWAAMQQSWPIADVLLKFAYTFLIQVTHSALAISRFTYRTALGQMAADGAGSRRFRRSAPDARVLVDDARHPTSQRDRRSAFAGER